MKQIVACIRKDLQLNYHGILLYGICTVGLPFLFPVGLLLWKRRCP